MEYSITEYSSFTIKVIVPDVGVKNLDIETTGNAHDKTGRAITAYMDKGDGYIVYGGRTFKLERGQDVEVAAICAANKGAVLVQISRKNEFNLPKNFGQTFDIGRKTYAYRYNNATD